MKKHVFMITLILSLLSLTGCSQKAQVIPETSAAEASTESTPTSAPETTPAETTAAVPQTTVAAREVTVSTETLTDEENIHITYPRLSGLKDEKQEIAWNDFFQKDAQKTADELEEGSVISCTWETVSGSARIISLIKRTELTTPDGAYPTVSLETYNIDSSTGKSVRLFQLCDVNAIAKDLADGNLVNITAPDGTDVTEQVTMVMLLELHSQFTFGPGSSDTQTALARLLNKVDYDGENAVSGYSYWKDGVLHLVFSYQHAVGDYIDIQIKDAHRSDSTK